MENHSKRDESPTLPNRVKNDAAAIAEAEAGLAADAGATAPHVTPNIGKQSPNEKPTGPICPHCLEYPCTKARAG